MAAETFGRALSLVLRHEGGFVDHPKDPGGATNLGVTIGTLSAWLGRKATKTEVKALTMPAVSPTYRRNYWNKVQADALPAGFDYCTFDAAVNSGPGPTAKWLQRAVGVEADGDIGLLTIKAAKSLPAAVVINRMCDDRLNFLKNLSTWGTFGKGSASRVEGVRKEALAMAAASPTVVLRPDIEPAPIDEPLGKPVGALIAAVMAALLALAVAIGVNIDTLKSMIP